MARQPCATCPWKKSTPRRGFPGGEGALACVGFVLQTDTLGTRLARVHGLIDPVESSTPLLSPRELVRRHGGKVVKKIA